MITTLIAIGSVAGAVAAVETSEAAAATNGIALAAPREFRLDFAAAADEPPADAAAPAGAESTGDTAAAEERPGFGSAGSYWLSAGGAAAYNFDEDYDFNANFMWSMFLADRLEFGIEGAGWYFNQVGEDTGGISGMFVLRYHWWSGPKGDFDWTSFLDLGTGMLAGFDEVPDGGTGFNFIQRAGLGFTKDLDAADGPAHGARMVFGIRWHHISNARFSGDSDNPDRDGVMIYAGFSFPL